MLELKPGANADAALAYLFKNSPLQINYSINLTCLLPADGAEVAVPRRLDLKTILQQFLDFRLEVVTRRLQFELKNLLDRIHILEGFAIVFKNLDEAIKIIRDSDGKADAAPKLIERFELSELQADAVLETKLYRLGKLEIRDIMQELDAKAEAGPRDQAAAGRRAGALADHPGRAQRDRPDVRRAAPHPDRGPDGTARVPRGRLHRRRGCLGHHHPRRLDQAAEVIHRRGEHPGPRRRSRRLDLPRRARQTLTIFTDRGVAYTMRVNDIPMTTGHGEPIQKQFAFEDQEHIVGVVCHDPRCLPDASKHPQTAPRLVQRMLGGDLDGLEAGDSRGDDHHGLGDGNGNGAVAGLPPPPYAIALTAGGKVLRFALAPLAAVSTRKGRQVVRLDPSFKGDLVVGVEATDGSENVCLATRSARVLIFPVTEANIVAGAARGVNAIRLDAKDRVIGFVLANKKREGLTVRTNRGATQIVRATKYPVTGRGGKGYAILQRGSLDSVVPDEAEPIPSLEEFSDAPASRNGAGDHADSSSRGGGDDGPSESRRP